MTKVPLASIQGIWKKAEELLAQPNGVVTAPEFDASVKMVASKVSTFSEVWKRR